MKHFFGRKKLYVVLFCLIAMNTTLISEKDTAPKLVTPEKFNEELYVWMGVFSDVLEKVHQKYYRLIDPKECMIEAISGFMGCLDPHSSFMAPDSYTKMMESTSGRFYGIGIVINNLKKPSDQHLMVVETIPGGPADQKGVQPGDKIIQIDGESLRGMSTDEAITKLKGKRNTTVKITVLRESYPEPLHFEIVRDEVEEQSSLSFYIKEHDTFYIALHTFSGTSMQQLSDLIKKSTQTNQRGLILDLRSNSGGLLTAVIDIVGLFVDKGNVVVTAKDREGKVIEEYKTTSEPLANNNLPIFILTNNFSASAAEILAGALRIHSDRGGTKASVFLVGNTTFGKGSVQEVIPLTHDCGMRLTISLYYLPDDTSIQGVGVVPDFEVKRMIPQSKQVDWFTEAYGRESSLKNFINLKPDAKKKELPKPDDEKTWKERRVEQLSGDNQLQSALLLLNSLHTARKTMPDQVDTRTKAVGYLKKNCPVEQKFSLVEVVM